MVRIGELLPIVREWSFQERWRANVLLPETEVLNFVALVEAAEPRRARIDEFGDRERLHFRVSSSGFRWRVMGNGEAVQTLAAEINQLRRTNEGLRQEIQTKDAEIALLSRHESI
jgi:hypothetical protein